MRLSKIILYFFLLAVSKTCFADNTSDQPACCYNIYDPYEKFNRKVFTFNETLDRTIFSPMAKVYNKTLPSWGRARIRGIFTNLSAPLTFLNNVAQGEGNEAAKTFFRFFVNTIFGFFGAIDFAKDFGLYERPQNFGDTFAHYGANYGAYLVLPIIGPSSVRQTAAIPFDAAFNPLNLYLDSKEVLGVYIGDKFTLRADYVDITSSLEASSLDYYAQIRSIYIQYLAKKNPKCKNVYKVDQSIYDSYED